LLETSARLLALLALLQQRREWSGRDLAERLEVDVRTVRRDVDRLRDLGYPVHASAGVGGGYQLASGANMPPLLLDDEEAVAVAVALESATGAVSGVEETAARVLAKLDQLLPARLRQRVRTLHSVTVAVPGFASPIDPEILTRIASACRDHEQLCFAYNDRKREATTRIVEPLRLAHTGRRWYLVAWDTTRADWRTFRVDRVEPPLTGGPRFTPRELPEDIAVYVARSISLGPYAHRARLKLHAPAKVMAERLSPWCGLLEPIDQETSQLEIGADTLSMLVAQMLMIGVDFEILDPPDLASACLGVIERLSRAVSSSGAAC